MKRKEMDHSVTSRSCALLGTSKRVLLLYGAYKPLDSAQSKAGARTTSARFVSKRSLPHSSSSRPTWWHTQDFGTEVKTLTSRREYWPWSWILQGTSKDEDHSHCVGEAETATGCMHDAEGAGRGSTWFSKMRRESRIHLSGKVQAPVCQRSQTTGSFDLEFPRNSP